ncbi:L,D-transpeptidase family protein [Pelobacter propionicus]|nr:L,D-transpeptidase family protein [Pelobacter propionicus]
MISNQTLTTFRLRGARLLAVAGTAILFSVTPCNADSRENARTALSTLQRAAISPERSGELASITESFTTAEEYQQSNNRDMAERYYLLCIQKSRVLFSSLAERGQKNAPLPPPDQPPAQADDKQLSSPEPTGQAAAEADANRPAENDFIPDSTVSKHLVGRTSLYTVRKHDTLRLISSKLGVSQQHLIRMNRLASATTVKPGQKLKYNNRKIIPRRMSHGIVINIPDRTLYYFKEGKLTTSLPVALGQPQKGATYDWMTPTGKFRVVAKQTDPTWYVPRSIRSEMEARGKDVKTVVPPGPRNPLGKYAIKTSLPGILIHSTTRPGSIYRFASHGCIRVYPEQMKDFFNEVRVNTPGEIIYQPVKLAVTEEGRVFLEVHHDAYGRGVELHALARQLIERRNIADLVDWNKVESVVKRREGLAEDVSL